MWQGENLYQVLEKIFKKQKDFLTAKELYEMPEVRKHASDMERVSTYVGNLWRRGLLVRLPARAIKEPTGRALWTYKWKGKTGAVSLKSFEGEAFNPKKKLVTPKFTVTQQKDGITVETGDFTIVIRSKFSG